MNWPVRTVWKLILCLGLGCEPSSGWLPLVPQGPSASAPVLGDVGCLPGAADCNVCATNVVAQFASAAWRSTLNRWSFGAPVLAELAPRAAYYPVRGHVQGFVQLNAGAERYAMVHSQEAKHAASLSFLGLRSGQLQLESLYRVGGSSGHTSGAFVLGRYVGLIDVKGQLALVDSIAAFEHQPLRAQQLKLSSSDGEAPFAKDPRAYGLSDWSGGIAMTKLATGAYLLMANKGGGSAGVSHFFRMDPFEGRGTPVTVALEAVGRAEFPVNPVLDRQYHHSENAALITECETGQLFAVHVGSNDAVRGGTTEIGGHQTFWRVSRVVLRSGAVDLEPVGVYLRAAHLRYCHGRSAGSAFVDAATRNITLLCHERGQGNSRRGPWRFWSERIEMPATTTQRVDPRAGATKERLRRQVR